MNDLFRQRSWWAVLAGLAFCLIGASDGSTLVLYGGTGSGGTHQFDLVEINLTDGSVMSRGDGRFWTGLDFTPDGSTLYGVSSRLYTVDTSTGTETQIGPLSLMGSDAILMRSMTISPSGEMYVYSNSGSDPSASSRLYTVDTSTGNLTLIGIPNATVYGIEFGPDGTLYGAAASLYELDPADASTIRSFGSLGADIFVTELDYSSQGLLAIDPDDSSASLYRIDRDGTPGSLAAAVAQIASDEVRSIASIPEPGTSVLIMMGLAVVFRRRSTRSR